MSFTPPTLLAGLAAIVLGLAAEARAAENLAAPAAGGRVVYFSSQYDEEWKVGNLFDGSPAQGWAGASSEAQSIVLAFKDDALATVEQVIVDPNTQESSNNWVKELEIEVSTTYPFKGFHSVGKFTVANSAGDQVFPLAEPTEARYVKVLFLTNYSDAYMEAGELKLMGTLVAGSPPAPKYVNAADGAAGATIVSETSGYPDWGAVNLLAPPDGSHGWAGTGNGVQEVVIALRGKTAISDISIDNYSRGHAENWAKTVAIEASNSAGKGYRPLGELTLPKVGDLHTLSLEKPVTARYVKLRFGSNYGGGEAMAANRVRVWTTEPPAR